jgi:hypothetical protein
MAVPWRALMAPTPIVLAIALSRVRWVAPVDERIGQRQVRALGSLPTPRLSRPEAQQDGDRFGDASLPRDPVPHRAGDDTQPSGRAHLCQAETLQGGAQLPSGHGHAEIKIGTICPCLASRHIVPIFSEWLLPFIGTAHAHVRTALRLLSELDDHLSHRRLATRERHALVRLLAPARRQLWLAVVALEAEPGAGRGSAVMSWVAMVAWPMRALTLILCCAWALVRVAIRAVRLVRVMWP